MIILGKKYTFTTLEISRLKKYHEDIVYIDYKNKTVTETINILELNIQKHKLIILNTKAKVSDELIQYLTKLEFHNIKYITIEHFMEKHLHKCYIPEDQTDLHFLENIKSFSFFQYIQKRFIDYVGSIILWLISIPLSYIIKKKIYKESRGKLYFEQSRVGQNGILFQCKKYRTMHENSYHNPYTQKEDNRIYPYGKFMRATRIDELPQFINILKGDMHLIGPRAEWDILVESYEQEIPYYNARHLVKPGITGWAQVNYPYGANTEDARQKLMYDLYYIKYWTIWLEIKTIYKTILVIIGKHGI